MKHICITGLDGCGKTTQAQLLAQVLPKSRIVSIWDIIKRPEFQAWTIYQKPPKVEQYVANLHPVSRVLFVFHAFNEAYQKALKSEADYLIFDGYWYKYWAIEQAMGAPASFKDFLKQQYPVPEWTFYLNLPIAEILKRKKDISIYESDNQIAEKQSAFVHIQEKARPILTDLLPSDAISIEATRSPDNIHRQILKNLNKH